MIAALVLAIVIAGARPDSGAFVTFDCVATAYNDSGPCRYPTHKVAAGDSVRIHWRIFSIPSIGKWIDDSVRVARGDTARVTVTVREVKYYIRYAWLSRVGMSNGPKTFYGCAKPMLLTARTAP